MIRSSHSRSPAKATATSRRRGICSGSTSASQTASRAEGVRPLTIGTRGSRLALRQVEIVRAALAAGGSGVDTQVVEIKTEGDASTAPLSEIGGAGVFSGAIEQALLERRIDIDVHSLKDLPPAATDGLLIAAIPERGDARDALVSRDGARLADLAYGARIGTGSARRAAQ